MTIQHKMPIGRCRRPQMPSLTRALGFALALTFVGGALAQASDPPIINASAPADTAGVIEAGGAALAMRKLVIGSFTVAFASHHTRSARQEGALGGSTTQTVEFNLEGLDAATMQRVADAAYASFIDAAKAQGYEVVGREELVAHPSFQAAAAAGKTSGLVREAPGLKSHFFAPSGMAINGIGLMPLGSDYAPGAASNLGALGALTSVAGVIGSTAEAVSSAKPLAAVSTAFGDATIVSVRLALFFAEQKGEFGSRAGAHTGVAVRSKLGLHVDAQNSMVTAWQPGEDKTRNFVFKKPLLVEGSPFRQVVEDSPTGQNVGLAILNAALGGRTSNKTTRFKVEIEPAKYGELATAALVGTGPVVFAAFGAPGKN
jgi:hypothetical protein